MKKEGGKGMKKAATVLLMVIIPILMGSCFLLNRGVLVYEGVEAKKVGEAYRFTTNQSFDGIEISFETKIPEENLRIQTPYLHILTTRDGVSTLSIVSEKGMIQKNAALFDLHNTPSVRIRKVTTMAGISERVSEPYPDGVMIKDLWLGTGEAGELTIHGKNIQNLSKIDLTVEYPAELLELNIQGGGNAVEYTEALSGFTKTENSGTAGTIGIIGTKGTAVNIADADMLKMKIKAKAVEGTAYITLGIGTTLQDGAESQIGCARYSGFVQIGGPVLLGDFNRDGKVDLKDFIVFARNYGTVNGDGRYNTAYDIGPAVKEYGGQWTGIYSKANKDSKVNITDFVVFAQNYYKAVETNQSPMVNIQGGPDGATGESAATFTWTGRDNDGTIEGYEIKKDEGGWTSNGQSATYTWEGYGSGARQFQVRAKDDAAAYSNTVTWTFTYSPGVTITAQASPASGGDVRINGGTWGDEKSTTVNSGTQVTLEASPASGYTFEGWYDGSVKVSSNTTYQVTATTNKTHKANFAQNVTQYTITAQASPSNGGDVRVNGGAWGD
ncbi:MAG TPA: hypothetical protein PLB79_07775, partial [Thermotogota bacterium]|nr:hypothetical protein [Thermotogota bacterium]